jgi:uncharacterized protein YoxC
VIMNFQILETVFWMIMAIGLYFTVHTLSGTLSEVASLARKRNEQLDDLNEKLDQLTLEIEEIEKNTSTIQYRAEDLA